jgi:arginase family enzyme
LKRERRVDLRYYGGAFADRGRDALGRAGANVADREHARKARLERKAVGLEVAVYNPRLDEDGSAGRGLADVLAATLGTAAP